MENSPPPRPPSLMARTMYLAGTAGRLAIPPFRDALEERDLTGPQHAVLVALDDFGRLAPRDVARRLRMHQAHVSKHLDTLERRGLVAREANPNDRRSVYISLTAAGAELVAALATVEGSADGLFAEALTEEELRTLRRLLTRVIDVADR